MPVNKWLQKLANELPKNWEWGHDVTIETMSDQELTMFFNAVIEKKWIAYIPELVRLAYKRSNIIDLSKLERLALESNDASVATSFAGNLPKNYDLSKIERHIIELGDDSDLFTYINRVNKIYYPEAIVNKLLGLLNNSDFNNFYKINNKLQALDKVLSQGGTVQYDKTPIIDWIVNNLGKIGINISSILLQLPWLDPFFIYNKLLETDGRNEFSDALVHLWAVRYPQLPLQPLLDYWTKHHDIYSGFKLLKEMDERPNIIKPTEILQAHFHEDFIILKHMFNEQYPNFNVEQFQTLIQNEENIEYIREMWTDPRFNINLFQKFLVEKKQAHLAVEFLSDSNITNNPNINVPLMQNLVEASGDSALMQKFAALNLKFNFKSFKKKYNDLLEKHFKSQYYDLDGFIASAYDKGKHLNGADREDYNNFIKELVDKKEWFYLTKQVLDVVSTNGLIGLYREAKNKTRLQVFNEGFRQSYDLIGRCRAIQNNFERGVYRRELIDVMFDNDLEKKLPQISNNLDQYVKFNEKALEAAKLLHDGEAEKDDLGLAIVNTKFRLEDPSNQELLELFKFTRDMHIETAGFSKMTEFSDKIDELNEKANQELINKEKFINNLEILKSLRQKFDNKEAISFQRGTPEYNALKKLHIDFSMINNFGTVKRYISLAKPKNPKLNDFNMEMPGGYQFRVLKHLDPYAFQVGADTDCCQRIGGAGESAAVDSFINPLAGVLLLEYADRVISQSYFHYVPEQNGLILDNVETSESYMKSLKLTTLDLSKIYADYAATLKTKFPELAYVKCGKGFNKLANEAFANSSMEEDPRHFEPIRTDREPDPDYGYEYEDEVYSDFDEEDHLDLLSPSDALRSMNLPVRTAAHYERTRQLTASFARLLLLKLAN